VEYDGRSALFDSPAPTKLAGTFECPLWVAPGPKDRDRLVYDEERTAGGARFVYGALGDKGELSSSVRCCQNVGCLRPVDENSAVPQLTNGSSFQQKHTCPIQCSLLTIVLGYAE
jgi:hypothetical protein